MDGLSDSNNQTVVRRDGWALGDVEAGQILIPPQSPLVLLQNLARILNVKYTNLERKAVGETMKNFRRIGQLRGVGLACLGWLITTLLQETNVCRLYRSMY